MNGIPRRQSRSTVNHVACPGARRTFLLRRVMPAHFGSVMLPESLAVLRQPPAQRGGPRSGGMRNQEIGKQAFEFVSRKYDVAENQSERAGRSQAQPWRSLEDHGPAPHS